MISAPTGAGAFASFDLDALTTGAARLRPDRLALADSPGAQFTYAALDERASSLAAHFAEIGLAAGECMLIVGGARASTVIATIAGLRTGLDVALAPAHLRVDELVAFANDVQAVALVAEAHYGDLALIEAFYETAASAAQVRLVCSLGGDADGAVELNIATLEPRPAPPRLRASADCRITTWRRGQALAHDQHALVAAALELLSRARIGVRDPVFSTLAPVSFGALAAGPVAALLAGCALHLHGPFDGAQFLAAFDACAPAHLVAPLVLAQALDAHVEMRALASLMISGGAVNGLSLKAQGAIPVIDIDGLGALAGARPAPNMARRENILPVAEMQRAAQS